MTRETLRFTVASWTAVLCCAAVLFWALPGHSASGNGNGNGNVGNFNGNGNSGNDNGNGNLGDGYGNWNQGGGNGNGPAWNGQSWNGQTWKKLSEIAPLSPQADDELLQWQRIWSPKIPPRRVESLALPPDLMQLLQGQDGQETPETK